MKLVFWNDGAYLRTLHEGPYASIMCVFLRIMIESAGNHADNGNDITTESFSYTTTSPDAMLLGTCSSHRAAADPLANVEWPESLPRAPGLGEFVRNRAQGQ